MCLDILLAFRKIKPLHGSRIEDNTKLTLYCLYAYGVPAAFTLTGITLQYSSKSEKDSPCRADLNNNACSFDSFFDERLAWLYFYGPYGGVICLNFCLILGAAILIIRHSRASSGSFKGSNFRRSTSKKQDRFMFCVLLTLFFLMGANGITEIIILSLRSSATSESLSLIIFYTLNNLIGVILFFFLVCKKRVLNRLRHKFNTWRKKVKLFSPDQNDSTILSRTSTQASTLQEETSSSKL